MAQNGKYSHYNIDALNGNNYEAWKFRVETILIEQNVEDMIRTEYKDEAYADERKREEARKRDNKCKSIIVQCIEDNQIDIVRNKGTAYAMWKSLRDIYEKKGLSGQLFLRRKLTSMKMEENERLEDFLLKFDHILCQLKTSGAEIREEDTVCTLLLALPKSYETVVTVLENLPAENINLDFIKAKLRTEAEKRKEVKGSQDEMVKSTAFIAHKSLTCYNCGEQGHFKRDCKKLVQNQQSYSGNRHGTHHRGGNRGAANRGGMHRGNTSQNGSNRRGGSTRTRPRYQRGGSHKYHSQYSQDQDTRKGNYVEADNTEENSICFMSDSCKSVQNRGNDTNIIFFIDSGCTDHLINEKSYFNDLMMLKNPIEIAVAKNNNYIEAIGIGNINVISYVDGKTVKCTIKNVLYVPNLRRNLLSVKKLEMYGIKVIFANGKVQLLKGKDVIGIGLRNSLYEIVFKALQSECLNVEVEDEKTKLWHKRYGHISYTNLKKLIDYEIVDGIEKLNLNKVEFCESCISGKITRLPFKTRKRSNNILEIVHSDVCGPINPTSHDNNKYFVTFIDDYSGFICVYIIKNKSEVIECFKEYAQMVQTKFNRRISTLRCDNGREYYSNEFKNYCKENGTVIDYTVPYTPQQNGKAERFNRTLVEKARSMISDSNVPKQFWSEAIRAAAYILNRSPNVNLDSITPAELWYDRKPDIKNLKIFGSIAYSHVPEQFRDKFDEKSEKCVMMGYAQNGYRLWNIKRKKIQISRNVIFNENAYYYKMDKTLSISIEDCDNTQTKETIMEEKDNDESEEELESDSLQSNDKGKRNKKVPRKFDDYEMYMAFDALSYVEQVPKDYNDLKNREDRNLWEKAMTREIESINKNKTWKLVIEPKDVEILDTKWVYTYKPHESDELDKYKARLVVRGFAQKKTFNYDELYSPVAKMTTIRTLLSIGNQYGYYFKQLDVKTAFLNGNLEENIYIYPPDGVSHKEGHIFKLNKSLYGLKQSSKCWNNKINDFLIALGFKRSNNDYCLYSKIHKNEMIYLLLYVDDIILTGPNLNYIEFYKTKLTREFDIKDKGELKNFLGLEINYDRMKGVLKINQKMYILGILKRFNFENCKPCLIPIEPRLKLNISKDNCKVDKPVRELIGCLMYLMLGSRPDLSFAVNFFSRYQDKCTSEIWNYLKRILRYLKGTVELSLVFNRTGKEYPLICYVDSDWGGDLHDRKSVSGYLIKVFGNTVSWVTRKQNCVALSTTEAELIALCSSVTDGLWFKKLLLDLNITIDYIFIFEDNQACISLVKNPENNRRVKHIDLKYNFVCENLKNNKIKIEYTSSKTQQADMLTKGLPYPLFCRNCKAVRLEF